MDFNIVAEVPQGLADMAVEIRLALGLAPVFSHVTLYRRFPMPELTDELDLRLIEFFRGFAPLEVSTEGHLKWEEANGLLYYSVNVPPEFMELRQKLSEILPAETPQFAHEYFPHITLGHLPAPGRNQRDLIDRLFFPAKWKISRFQLESESTPGKWTLEAGYTLG